MKTVNMKMLVQIGGGNAWCGGGTEQARQDGSIKIEKVYTYIQEPFQGKQLCSW